MAKGFEKGVVDLGGVKSFKKRAVVFGGSQKLQEESLLLYGQEDLQAIHNGGRTWGLVLEAVLGVNLVIS